MKHPLLPRLLLLLALITTTNYLHAQNDPPKQQTISTPGAIFDKVYDRFGKEYKLDDIRIISGSATSQGKSTSGGAYSQILCTSTGYFNIYFENGSGFELSNPTHIARRDVICQLFNDLSNFIVPANPSVKVNIWVRDISAIVPSPSTSGVLGLATSFYTMPAVTPASSGIVDGEIWKTINSGADGYTNVVSPLVTQGGMYTSPGGAYYHGMMAFNFANPSINWHTTLTSATSAGLYDLYSVALHEVTHALGFASLIDYNGLSKFGTSYKFYSRYDLFLKTQGGQNLITNTGSCSMYDYQFNPSLTAGTLLSPNPASCGFTVPYSGSLDNTTCATAINFAGVVNQPVYTPDCFEPPSSLSHLEDQCHTPSAYPNNQYYCMSNANGTGSTYMKRYLKPEERFVLCDIGYKVNTSYGNTLFPSNNYSYGGVQCPGQTVAGVNDGITTLGAYSWTALTSGSVGFTGGALLGNDFSANQFECLQVVNGMGTISPSSGTSGTSITFNAGSTSGVALLRYTPVNTITGKRGNITYAYVYVQSANCPASPCNMVINGGFENGLNCGQYYQVDAPDIYCWTPLAMSPDYFVRGCIPPSGGPGEVPTNTAYCNPASDTWSGPSTGNDKFMGIGFYNSTPGSGMEAVQTLLSTPVQPNVPYTLSFWARTLHGSFFVGTCNLEFRGSTGTMASLPWATPYNTVGNYYTDTDIPDDGQWHYYTLPFTYTGTSPLPNFMVGITGYGAGWAGSYALIDDVVLTPANNTASFTLPDTLCNNDTLLNLAQYVSPAMTPGSSFTGPGVTSSGGVYSLIPAVTQGYQTITYNYVTAVGCTLTVYCQIYIDSCGTIIVPPTGTHHVMTYEVHDDMKHYTTKMVPNTNDESVMAGTIFHSTSGGLNTIHFMRLDDQGNVIVSEEYYSKYNDQRTVDLQGFEFNGKQYWYIVCQARRGGSNPQDLIKVLCVDNNGVLIDQREYEDMTGGKFHLYPMHSTIWSDPSGTDNRLYICGYTTVVPTTYPAMPDYQSPKHAFLFGIDIDQGPSHFWPINNMAYDWPWGGALDYDMAMRTAVVPNTNEIFMTGSVNGIMTLSPVAPLRSGTMNIVVDPNSLMPTSDFPFVKNTYTPDLSGPHEYGVDVIQIQGRNYILGNTASVSATPWNSGSEIDMYPRWNKLLFIQPLNNGNPFGFQGKRNTFSNTDGHWAAHAIQVKGMQVTLATLIRDQYAGCIPTPNTPAFDNVDVDLITADLGTWPYGTVMSGPNMIYRTNTGTGDPASVPNSFYDLGQNLSLMDYSPTFAALGTNQYVINAPKYMNGLLNLKFMNPDLGFNTICGGDYDANQIPCSAGLPGNTYFFIEDVMKASTQVKLVQIKLDKTPFPLMSYAQSLPIAPPVPCIDLAGNSSYKTAGSGVEAALRDKTIIYPNPATDKITVELSKDISPNANIRIKLTSIYGQEIKDMYDNKARTSIELPLPSVAAGLYFIRVYSDGKLVHHEKLTIK